MKPGLAWKKLPRMVGATHSSWVLNRWDGCRWHDEGAIVRDHYSGRGIIKGWVVLTPSAQDRKAFQPNRKPVAVFATLAEAKAFAWAEAEARPVAS